MRRLARRSRAYALGFLVRSGFLTVLWLTLTKGDFEYWWLGAAGVLAAAFVSLRLSEPGSWRVRLTGLPPFIQFFLVQSLLGGLDVARRALNPRRQVKPHFVDYTADLPSGWDILFADIVSLLPGSLVAGVEGGTVRVHVLDQDIAVEEKLHALEARLRALKASH